jgi:hypothetical protein
MPLRFAEHSQTEISDNLFAGAANRLDIAKQLRRATLGIHKPLSSNAHDLFEKLRLLRRTVTGYKEKFLRASHMIIPALIRLRHLLRPCSRSRE